MQRAAPRDPGSPVHAALTLLGIAVAGWVGVIAFHAVAMSVPQHDALNAFPPAVRALIKICGSVPDTTGSGIGNWMLGWTLMVVAMMLPPALPLLRAGERLLQSRTDRDSLIAVMLGAFVATWIGSGMALFVVGSIARIGIGALPALGGRVDLAAGIAAIMAGLFQFTPLKMACMDACRSPASVMMVRWRGTAPRRSAMRIGAQYGAICVGCCWAMMILSVLVGALMLPIMVVCALLMTLERLLPWFRPLIPIQAGFAVAIGVLLLAGALPSAFL